MIKFKVLLLVVFMFVPFIEAFDEVPRKQAESYVPVVKSVQKADVCVAAPNLKPISDMDLLHPIFREKVQRMLDSCRKVGIDLYVSETYRTYARQDYLFYVKKVTKARAGHSFHQRGLGIDVVPVVKKKFRWNDKKLWKRIGLIGESFGLRWGGRWKKFHDPGHFELDQEDVCEYPIDSLIALNKKWLKVEHI